MDRPGEQNRYFPQLIPVGWLRKRLPLTLVEKLLGISLLIHDGGTFLKRLSGTLRKRLEEGELDEMDYRAFRTLLNQYPDRLRDATWYQVSILLDATAKKHPERTFNHLRLLRQQEDTHSFEAFWKELKEAIAPYSLTQHGYMKALEHRDERTIWREIREVADLLDSQGLRCFLNSGTLLGIVREGGFLPHDDDVDLAVLLGEVSDRAAARKWAELGELLDRLVHPPYRLDLDQMILYKIICPDNLEVDLFPAWLHDDRVFVWPYLHGELTTADLFPLHALKKEFPSLLLPARPEAFLEINYGESWRIPDPSFRFDWERAKQQFTAFTETLENEKTIS